MTLNDFDALAKEARDIGRRATAGSHSSLDDVAALSARLAKVVEQLAAAFKEQARTQERGS